MATHVLPTRAAPQASRVEFDLDLRARVAEVLDRWPSAGVGVAVVRDGSLECFLGHGVADVTSREPITEETVFRVGSLTKTFTAIAVMQLWERGFVDLDAPANDYLRRFRLVPAKASFRPATVRHLLTHTAGFGYWRRLSDLLRPGVRLGRPGGSRGRTAARRLLPERAAGRGRAGDEVGLLEPRLRRAGADRGGRDRRAARPLPHSSGALQVVLGGLHESRSG